MQPIFNNSEFVEFGNKFNGNLNNTYDHIQS